MTLERYQAAASRLESEARTLATRQGCSEWRGLPVDGAARKRISAKYRCALNGIMRRARQAFAEGR